MDDTDSGQVVLATTLIADQRDAGALANHLRLQD